MLREPGRKQFDRAPAQLILDFSVAAGAQLPALA